MFSNWRSFDRVVDSTAVWLLYISVIVNTKANYYMTRKQTKRRVRLCGAETHTSLSLLVFSIPNPAHAEKTRAISTQH